MMPQRKWDVKREGEGKGNAEGEV
jgi:hypothetical protein